MSKDVGKQLAVLSPPSDAFRKSQQPEPDRLIQLWGHDWSPFTCLGKFVPYKPGSPKRLIGRVRFMRWNGLSFEADRDSWWDATHWRYAEESDRGEGRAG